MLRVIKFLLFTLFCYSGYAQNVGINATGAAPAASAGLDVNFTDKGFLTPRMTLAQRTAISSPATGLLVYQTDAPSGFYYHNGSGWAYLTTSATAAWALVGNTSQTAAAYNSGSFIGNQDNNPLRFRTNNTQRMFIHATNGGVAVGTDPAFNSTYPERFLVDAGGTQGSPLGASAINLINGKGYNSTYLQLNVQNLYNGATASSDVVATNNTGTEANLINFVDMGINSTGNTTTGVLGGASTAYLYSTGNDFSIGNATPAKNLKFFTNGTADTDERMRITSAGLVGIATDPTERLDVNGKAVFGTTGTNGKIKISNTQAGGATDIFTEDNVNLRITNHGSEQTGASLQLKNSALNYLFSFEGRGGFRYYSRVTEAEKFRVNDGGDIYLTTTNQNTALDAKGTIDDYYQLNIQNLSNGTSASTDIVATNNTADGTDYINMGINSTGYDNTVSGVSTILNGARATYLYGNGAKMIIGNSARLQPLIFFTNNSASDGGDDARGTERMRIEDDGQICMGTTTPHNSSTLLTVNGQIRTSGTLVTSDKRLKTNIQGLNYGLKDILSLNPVKYNWIDPKQSSRTQLGLIAQDAKEIIPEIVEGDGNNGMLALEYTALIPVLINAIKEQQKQIEDLKQQVQKLQK